MAEVYSRIKSKGAILFAKPIRLKEGISEEHIKNLNVMQRSSKHFKDVFEVAESKSKMPSISKWTCFEDAYGIVDVAYLDDIQYAEYCVDFKIGVYKSINNIIKNDGFKFRNRDSLKKHVFLVLRDELLLRFNDDFIRYVIDYYFNKAAESFNARKKRFLQKAYCNFSIWNYFVTYTYDPEIFDSEDKFSDYLKKHIRRLASRNNVKYMGAFEKSPKGRLHFHAIMSLPDDYVEKLDLQEEMYYDKSSGEVKTAMISQILKKNIGRCDFKFVSPDSDEFIRVLDYICKYISKQESKIIYSRGLRDEIIGKIDDFDSHKVGFISMLSTFYLMDGTTEYKEI